MSITIRSTQTIRGGLTLQGSYSLLINPQLYLDADDITASSWPDRSPYGNNATPLYAAIQQYKKFSNNWIKV